jgi:hypothetical protein
MQKYALKTFDMFFVMSWNEFLTHLEINSMVQKNMQMQQLPNPIHKYAKKKKNDNDKKPLLFKKYFQHFM